MDEVIVNAIITDTKLGLGHYAFTFDIVLELSGGGGVVFGGYAIGHCGVIAEVLKTVGYHFWEELQGKAVRCKLQGGRYGKISHIGHLMNDKWFSLEEYFKKEKIND